VAWTVIFAEEFDALPTDAQDELLAQPVFSRDLARSPDASLSTL
jgi:hypothetical protein